MALSDAYDMLTDTAADIWREHAAMRAGLQRKQAIEAELDVLASGDAGKNRILNAIEADRAAYRAATSRWQDKMDTVLGYWGSQLSTPSAYVRGSLPVAGRRRELLRDIRAHMAANSISVAQRKATLAAEPAAADNGILDRLTVDENGDTISAGLHNQTLDAVVVEKASQYASTIEIKARNQGNDIFDLQGPAGSLLIQAVNSVYSGDGLVSNPNLNQGLSSNANAADLSADTAHGAWTLTKTGSPTHVWDTSIKYQGNTGSHKLYGNNTARKWSQPLVIRRAHRRLPRNYMVAIYVTGTPVARATVVWGSKSQVHNLSAGWNYLRLDRDKDLYPVNFEQSAAVLSVEVALTSGSDSSNYVNVCFVGGQNYRQFDGLWYGHWSRTAPSAQFGSFSFADTMSQESVCAWALYLAYHATADRQHAFLREAASPSITEPADLAPEIAITHSGSNVADGGTIALGSVASGPHSVTLRVFNSGHGPLAIGVPVVTGSPTNASLTDAGISVPKALGPQEYTDITVEVTDGGAGAFSLTLRIDNNDASEGTYEITISGTAT